MAENGLVNRIFTPSNIVTIILGIIELAGFYLLFPTLKKENCILAGIILGVGLTLTLVGVLVLIDKSRKSKREVSVDFV